MAHTHPKNRDDLKDLRENEEHQAQAKAEMFEQNPLLHAPAEPVVHKPADNENTRHANEHPIKDTLRDAWNAIPGTEPLTTLLHETRSQAGAHTDTMLEQLHGFQDNLGTILATQRRIAELWMETWCSVFVTPFLNFTLETLEPKEEREAKEASALVMGA